MNPMSILLELMAHKQGLGPVSVEKVTDVIANSEKIAIVKTKPMMKSVEGWAATVGAGTIVINALGPVLGLQINGQLTGAIETITTQFGFAPGTGTAAVYAVAGIAFVVVWVRKKWFTHTITPAAADRGAAMGKVV